jgi:transaldolase
MIDDGIRGLTSNPAIFKNAIAGSADYDGAIAEADDDASAVAVFERLAIADIQEAADLLRGVYDTSRGDDGYVSLEVSPHLAYDTEGTIADAHRLWNLVNRPNLMIKVPATDEGVPAIEELIAAGVNVNSTLMFSLQDYEVVAQAYIRGLRRVQHPESIASVASFFVSRVDTSTDAALEKNGSDAAMGQRGKAAVANAKLAYDRYREIFESEAFADLRDRGARAQRVLWASTGTKNPEYSDVLYVEPLIGQNTVNTMPPATINAFLDHGDISKAELTKNVDEAKHDIAALADFGIDFAKITSDLKVAGVKAFQDSYDDLLDAVTSKIALL